MQQETISILPHQYNKLRFIEIDTDGQLIGQAEDVLSLFGILYGQEYDGVILHENNLLPAFFDLKTRLAGVKSYRSSLRTVYHLLS